MFIIGTRLPVYGHFTKAASSLPKITQTCKYFMLLAKFRALKLEFWHMTWHEMGLNWYEVIHIEKLMSNPFHFFMPDVLQAQKNLKVSGLKLN